MAPVIRFAFGAGPEPVIAWLAARLASGQTPRRLPDGADLHAVARMIVQAARALAHHPDLRDDRQSWGNHDETGVVIAQRGAWRDPNWWPLPHGPDVLIITSYGAWFWMSVRASGMAYPESSTRGEHA